MKYILILIFIGFAFGCGKAGNKSVKANQNTKPNQINHTPDSLKNKLNPEILKLKYGGSGSVILFCQTEVYKNLQLVSSDGTSALNVMLPQEAPPSLVVSGGSFTYDLNEQLKVDKSLTSVQKVILKRSIDGIDISYRIKIEPLFFNVLENINIDNSYYVLKYSPVIKYQLDFTLAKEGQVFYGSRELSAVYENIKNQKIIKEIIDDSDSYRFQFNCLLQAEINTESPNREEYLSQWKCIGANCR